MTLENLKKDPKVELFSSPKYDTYYFSKLELIGIYHDTVDKAIIQRVSGRISIFKIRGKGYIEADGIRMYLKYFKSDRNIL